MKTIFFSRSLLSLSFLIFASTSTAGRNSVPGAYVLDFEVQESDLIDLKKMGEISDWTPNRRAVIVPHNKAMIEVLSTYAHDKTHKCGSFSEATIGEPTQRAKVLPPLTLIKNADVSQLVQNISQTNIQSSIEHIITWGSRYHDSATGIAIPQRLADLYKNMTPIDRTDIKVEFFKHASSKQNSLIITIVGKTNPQEIVILGSHLDSINQSNKAKAPGADDNATGIAIGLEIFKNIVENAIFPDRTIEIHAYAAEEIGLVGSNEIAKSYTAANKTVVAMMALDMSGYSEAGDTDIYLVSNKTTPELNTEVSKYVDFYLSRKWQKKSLLFGSSDHASWYSKGYPTVFPTENPNDYNPNIHSDMDLLVNLNDPDRIRTYGQLGFAYLLHYSKKM
ncbi:MAG: M20/M25/M40 family metallo-hydrolase [Bdellovibrionaceae bacterium]|nr:M20/M25/M40 family metallo-hydrolase [Pseudobdellovibrionaceae bacterium]